MANRTHEEQILTQSPPKSLSPIASDVIRTLLYFDIFSFPLSLEEIHSNCQTPIRDELFLRKCLKRLTELGFVQRSGEQYFINGNESWVDRKHNGARMARRYLTRSKWMSRLISQFPFVRGLGISGSLSKGYADRESDVDYFVITKKGRLWLSRTCIVLFKKIFMLNSRKWLCANYFVDESNLKIPDENCYTATELVYLMPYYNDALFLKIKEENPWIQKYKPNFRSSAQGLKATAAHSFIKKFAEWCLDGKWGDKMDDLCFSLTYRYWKKKFGHLRNEEFRHAFRSEKNVSKHHPQNFQKKVLEALDLKIAEFEKKHKVVITT